VIRIRDNGKGVGSKKDSHIHSTGKGLKIISDIFRMYTEITGKGLSYKVRDLTEEGVPGTEVTIRITT
jgi:hypothetical protein